MCVYYFGYFLNTGWLIWLGHFLLNQQLRWIISIISEELGWIWWVGGRDRASWQRCRFPFGIGPGWRLSGFDAEIQIGIWSTWAVRIFAAERRKWNWGHWARLPHRIYSGAKPVQTRHVVFCWPFIYFSYQEERSGGLEGATTPTGRIS